MEGDILHPLNMMKDISPELFRRNMDKYASRKEVTEQKIPGLDCLWNDVIHFSPVNPVEVKKALVESGYTTEFNFTCYEIDPHLLDRNNTIVFLHKSEYTKDKMNPKNFAAFDPDDIAKYSVVPQFTIEYYKEKVAAGRDPLLYHGIVHILYKGTLNVKGLKLIDGNGE